MSLKNLKVSKWAKMTVIAAVTVAGGAGVAMAEDNYGAIAYSTSSGAYGYAYDAKTKGAAQRLALKECDKQGRGCKNTIWFKNACGSIAIGKDGWGASWGKTKRESWRKAREQCRTETTGCKVKRWVCTTRTVYR